MNVLSVKGNATNRSMIFLKFWRFQKVENSKKIWFLKIWNFKEIMGTQENEWDEWRGTLRVLRAETWLTVYRTIASTETVAKPGRLGPAQNDKPMRNFIELTMFCIISEDKSSRISCPEYIVDLDKCIKTYKRRCHGQIYDISGPGEISKKWDFSRKCRKI